MEKPNDNFQSRIIGHFTQPSPGLPVAAATLSSPIPYAPNACDDTVELPATDSIFLIRIGGEADDLAHRLDSLQEYTKGLLQTISKANGIRVSEEKTESK